MLRLCVIKMRFDRPVPYSLLSSYRGIDMICPSMQSVETASGCHRHKRWRKMPFDCNQSIESALTSIKISRGENTMTAVAMKKAASLEREISKNSAKVGNKISRKGKREDEAIAISSAKYYKALKKLAEK